MKNFSFDGRLGKDAEVKTTKGGKPYVRFSVANNSFSGGTETTEWIDVTSYDQYIVENRAKYLTKGTYVIVNGDVRFDIKVGADSKIWKNIYVNATAIDTPNFGKKDDAEAEAAEAPAEAQPQTTAEPVPHVAVAPAAAPSTPMVPTYNPAASAGGDDDLPF